MIKKIDHIALSVSNLERSIKFYQDIIGFKVTLRLEKESETPLDEVTGLLGCTAKIAHLSLGRTLLELFEYKNPHVKTIQSDKNQFDLGWIHMGFTSTDFRADYAKLKAQGIKFLSKPIEFRPKVWVVYFYGPDGEVCELRETPESKTQS
ncbi:MAG TPA: VOC family protein [Desulfosporosinus sp.]|nr:VOC family protein [Desulfosporosinus sp.]